MAKVASNPSSTSGKRGPGATGVQHQVSLAAALRDSESLNSLLQRLQASKARLEAVLPLLPEALRPAVQAGGLDEGGWSLLVDNPAAAAKLRQLLPDLQARLQQAGWHDARIRLKVQAGRR